VSADDSSSTNVAAAQAAADREVAAAVPSGGRERAERADPRPQSSFRADWVAGR
jgi:hypothetical protein